MVYPPKTVQDNRKRGAAKGKGCNKRKNKGKRKDATRKAHRTSVY